MTGSRHEPRHASPTARPGSLWRTVRAVAWSLLGIRKGDEYRQDTERINPLHIIAVGLVAIVLLVAGLIAVVNWVV
ncbi:hypothetical protein C8246_20290 [Paracidovorax avenae]|uniref:DUF2970 domain-containing protein n=1 Tax=Paracidovorax avenae TaxID=80867 RepID=UPI000D154A6A|nr:DUF2970 domain-containing protein [Paracidovorax avenae]AVS78772.1 hypothetical protein C8234_12300 [Paracidovorax avenae]AVS82358.1 hypothetical protein C8237_15575 [Paracidovorax avenae]AVS85883.1 hypothetical protein C8239_14925 [Paracidovorax avenae]AVS89553.1 hypothetical protein C8238_16040 [Paracidovorax avenae]AVS93704.1 hypothetical protein C8246_20290 [Paracidovorax avenae]